MIMMSVLMEDMVREWERNPHKLVSWLLRKIWSSGIKPDDGFEYHIGDGYVVIGKIPKELKGKNQVIEIFEEIDEEC